MPKSKEYVTSESDSDSEVEPAPKKKKQEKKEKKEEKKEKKPEKESSKSSKGDSDEVKIELSRMRFASVQEFRGKKLISIREYYEKDGEMLPGRKGISLTVDQWNKLKDAMQEIDDAL